MPDSLKFQKCLQFPLLSHYLPFIVVLNHNYSDSTNTQNLKVHDAVTFELAFEQAMVQAQRCKRTGIESISILLKKREGILPPECRFTLQ